MGYEITRNIVNKKGVRSTKTSSYPDVKTANSAYKRLRQTHKGQIYVWENNNGSRRIVGDSFRHSDLSHLIKK